MEVLKEGRTISGPLPDDLSPIPEIGTPEYDRIIIDAIRLTEHAKKPEELPLIIPDIQTPRTTTGRLSTSINPLELPHLDTFNSFSTVEPLSPNRILTTPTALHQDTYRAVNRSGLLMPAYVVETQERNLAEESQRQLERLVIPFPVEVVSIRLPNKRSFGGMVEVIGPIVERKKLTWSGYPDPEDLKNSTPGHLPGSISLEMRDREPIDAFPIPLDHGLYQRVYDGYMNDPLWYALHGIDPDEANLDEEASWQAFNDMDQMNRDIAQAINLQLEENPDTFFWLHDYGVKLAGQYINTENIGFMLHTTFRLKTMSKLPQIGNIMHAMLTYKVVGFQTEEDLDNFEEGVRQFIPDATIERVDDKVRITTPDKHVTVLKATPVGIDPETLKRQAHTEAALTSAYEVRQKYPGPIIYIQGRMDPKNGITSGLEGIEEAFKTYPEFENATCIVVAPKSRENIPSYATERDNAIAIKNRINQALGREAVVLINEGVSGAEKFGYYHAADIALFPSWEDGMNVTAEEIAIATLNSNLILCLSETMGVSRLLGKDRGVFFKQGAPKNLAQALLYAYNLDSRIKAGLLEEQRLVFANNTVHKYGINYITTAIEAVQETSHNTVYEEILFDRNNHRYV